MDYTKLMKGLEMCAGPECCKDGCPYYGETTGGMTCRARLLRDAEIAINNEHAVRGATEAELQGAKETMEAMEAEYRAERKRYGELFALNKALEEDARSVRAHRDAIAEDRAKITVERDKLLKECEELKEYALAVEREGQEARAERDKLGIRLANLTEMRDKLVADKAELRKECDMLATRCTVLQNEINALLLKKGKRDGKTDRPSVEFDGELLTGRPDDVINALERKVKELLAEGAYWNGKARAYMEILNEYGFYGPGSIAKILERCFFGGGGRHE